jgi:hypothetical protein
MDSAVSHRHLNLKWMTYEKSIKIKLSQSDILDNLKKKNHRMFDVQNEIYLK